MWVWEAYFALPSRGLGGQGDWRLKNNLDPKPSAPSMRRSLPQLMFTVLVLGMLLLREADNQPMAGIEENFINWLAANSNGEHVSAPVTLVEINDNCMVNYSWPWTPLNYALFLNASLEFKARALGIEPVLAWDEKQLQPDELLQQPQY